MKHLLSHDWVAGQGSYEKSGKPPELPHSLPCLWGKPMCVCAPHKQHPSFPQSSHYCWSSSKQPRGSSSCRTPRTVVPTCDSHCLFCRADLCPHALPFGLSPLPGTQILTQFFFFPSYPVICGSFLQAWLFTSFSATFRPLNLPSWFISLCLFPTLLVWQNNLHKLLFTTISLEITSLTDDNRIFMIQ